MLTSLYIIRRYVRSWCLLVFCAMLPLHFSVAEEVEIIGYEIPMLMDSPDKGLLVDLMKHIGARANMQLVFTLVQKDQIPQVIENQMASITRDERDLGFPGYPSKPIFERKTFAFYKKNMPRIMTIYNLRGREVGMSFGYDADADFMGLLVKNKIKVRKDKTESTMLRHLHKNRVEALIMEEYAGLVAIKITTFDDVTYEARRPLWKKFDHILFPKTETGKGHAARFNAALKSMYRDGSYKAFIAKAYDAQR